ncbi:hypothetical protein ADL15_27995 [Actinoplanes awajinensis subsp. mycoplanecinus]|uniref:HTH cro/C1-type domain-containing protein n=2 Tax=Actinoplanes awajinensis TaxID=135946 RepID=A0A101JMI3_9ACTN|nr:hypothetical protein ADL15_27995 [Actinoplanes awajinensis subsp. mycoplanecinus]
MPSRPLTVKQRRLAAELLTLRGRITREKVVEDTGISEGALLKMEKGRTRPQRRTLITLLDYYGATPEKRVELLDLWQHSTRSSDLQPIEESLPENYQALIALEAEAVSLGTFEGLFVPGLLQTEEYAHAVIRSQLPEMDDAGISARVEARMHRRDALNRSNAVRYWAILDEAVIRRTVGGEDVMRGQLAHLAELGKAGNTITIQIIPFSAGAHGGMIGSFLLLEFDAPYVPVVYLENFSGGLFVEAAEEVARYRDNFQRLVAQALSPQATLHMIEEAVTAA